MYQKLLFLGLHFFRAPYFFFRAPYIFVVRSILPENKKSVRLTFFSRFDFVLKRILNRA